MAKGNWLKEMGYGSIGLKRGILLVFLVCLVFTHAKTFPAESPPNSTNNSIVLNDSENNSVSFNGAYSEPNLTREGLREEVIQGEARVGERVRWKKRVYTSDRNLEVEIPGNAEFAADSGKEFVRSLSGADSDYVEVEYETEAPKKLERNLSEIKKEVLVYSSEHYENVSVSTDVEEHLFVWDKNLIQVYWQEENKYLDFEVIDRDNNSLIDGVGWIVPHLSNQTFQIIIITKALHLDENRSFVEDVYGQVSRLDDSYATIQEGNYLRVVFEKLLDNSKDITIYAKSHALNATVEVYEKDSDVKIADFGTIGREKKYQILLTNLVGMQDTFDLLVKGGTILFNYIVDPIVTDESSVAQIYQNGVTQDGDTEISIQFNSETVVGSKFSHPTNTNLQFNEAGLYKISYGCLMEETTSTLRQEQTMWLDDSLGNEIFPSRAYTYLRSSADGQGDFASMSAVTLVNISAGDNITVQTDSLYGSNNVDPEESCWLYAEKVHRPAVLARETTDYDNQITAGTPIIQDLGETVYEDSSYFTADLANNWVTIDQDGWYKIYYVAGSEQTVGTNDNDRSTPTSYIYINNSAELEPSMTYSYHKRADQAAYSSEEGYTMAYLTTGSNVSLRRFLLEDQATTPGQTYTLKDSWIMMEKFEDDNVLLLWDTTGGQQITGTAATKSAFSDITWDTEEQVGSYYSHTPGAASFTIDEDGWFEISYAVSFDGSTGSNRKVSCARVTQDGTPLEPSHLCEYLRDNTVEDNSVAANFIVNNTAGMVYAVQHAVTPQNTGGGHTLIADSSWVSVTPIKILDTTNPNVSILSPLGSINYSTQDFWFNVSTNDSKEMDSCWFNLDNGANITMSNQSDIYYYHNVSVPEGQHTAYFFCNDTSNNLNDTESVSFGVDVTPPSIVLYEPQNTSYNFSSLSINFTVSDDSLDSCWFTNNSGVNNYSLPGCQNQSYSASQGGTTITVYANDSAGNENSSTVTFFVDSIIPFIDFAPNAYQSGAVITGESVFTNVTVVEDNEKNVTFYLYNSGLTIERENPYTDGTHSITWNLLSEGLYFYNVTVYDILNNFNYTETRNITLDNSAPVVNYGSGVEVNNSNKSRSWVFVNVSLTEDNEANTTFYLYNDSGIVDSQVYTDGTHYHNFTGLNDGTYYYNVTVYDKANQFSSTSTLWINLDTVFPKIDFEPETKINNSNLSQSFVYANVSVIEDNEASITFGLYNDSGEVNVTTYTTPAREINWTGLNDGIYYYNITVSDFAGNENLTETRWITLDVNAPSATLLSPGNESYVDNATQNMTFNASDGIELRNATLFVYNSTNDLINLTTINISGTDAIAGIVYEFFYDGVFQWFYRVFDWAGNWFDTGNYTVTVDTVNPQIDYGLSVELNDTNFSRNWIYVNVSVVEENEANITFGLYNSVGNPVSVTTYDTPVRERNWTGLNDGLYFYNVTVVDLASRKNYTVTNQIRIDDTAPAIDIVNPKPISYAYNESLPLDVDVSDNLIGLDSCWWRLDSGANNSIPCGTNTTFDASDGLHTIYFFANDTLGNFASDYVTFSVSATGPSIVLLAPANETFFSAIEPIIFNFTATSPAGISNCSLYGDWNGGWHLNQTIKDEWWNESWGFRNKLNIEAVSAVTDDYTVDIEMSTLGPHFQDDADDLRVVYWNGTDFIELDRIVVRPNESDSRVQFKLQANISASSNNSNYAVYYGNPSATNPPGNASNVWYFYDDFSTGSTSMWGPSTGGYRINTSYTNPWTGINSVLELGVGCGSDVMKVNQTFFPVTRDIKIRALWYDNPGLLCTGGSPDSDGILGLRGDPATSDNDGLLLEWDTDTGFHYDVGATGSVDGDFIPFEEWIWTESVAYGTGASGHKGKHWNFTEDEPDTYQLQATAVSATSPGVPYIRTASGTALVGAVFASILVQDEPIVTIQDEAWNISTVVNMTEDGDFNWNVICYDNNEQGDFALYNLTFSIDETNPLIEYGEGLATNNSNLSRNWVYVNVSVTEDNEENITFGLYNDGGEVNVTTYTTPVREINFTGLSNGRYYYNVTVIDRASHQNSTETRWITLDTENPNGIIISPGDDSYSNNTFQNFTINATDNNGLWNVTLYIFNSTGALIHQATQSVYDMTEAIAGLAYTFLVDGVFTWFYEVADLAGNKFTTDNQTITIDTVYPQIDFGLGVELNDTNFSRNWIYVNVTVVEENEANITFGLYNDSGEVNVITYYTSVRERNWTGLKDGTYYYNVSLYDFAGQINYTETRTIRLDTVPPSVAIDSPIDQNYSTSLIWFNVTTDGASSCNYTLDGGTTNSTMSTSDNLEFSASNSSVADGQYTVNFYCSDDLGNLNDTESRNFGVDATLPFIEFGNGTEKNDSYFVRDWVNINVTVVEENEANITFTLYDSDGLVDFTNTYTNKRRNINITNRIDRTYSYNVTVVDVVGNANSTETRFITLDNVNPVVDYTEDIAGNDSNRSQNWIYVNVSVTEDNEKNITFELYNGTGEEVNVTTYTTPVREINWTGLAGGSYYYNVTVYDMVNLSGYTETRWINLEYTNPLVSFANDTEDNDTEFERNWIYVNVSVVEENEANITFGLYNDSGEVNVTTYTNLVREINWTGLSMANVTYHYNVTVVDFYDNRNYTETRYLKLYDNTKPFVRIVNPEATVYGYNESLPLDFNVKDSGSGVDRCWYNIDGLTNVTLDNCANSTFNVSGSGGYVLTLFANDSVGNLNQTSVAFTVSLLGPGITLISPPDNTNFTGFSNSYFNFSAIDPDGVYNCTLWGTWNGGWHANQTKDINWWGNDWEYRKEINITYQGSGALSDFPIYINVSNESEMQGDYGDLRFVNGSCSRGPAEELPYEIEAYDSASADVWVKLSDVSVGVNSICMYYGNSGVANGEDISSTWDSIFESVYHLDDSEGGTAEDTKNNYDMNEINSVTNVDGISGYATGFDGGSDELNSPDGWRDTTSTPTTWEAWVRTTSATVDMVIMEDGGSSLGLALGMDAGVLGFYAQGSIGSDAVSPSGGYNDGGWHHVAGVHSASANILYVDGVQVNSVGGSSNEAGTGNAGIGGASGTVVNDLANNFNGDIDEVRFSDDQRSAGWINLTYQNIGNYANTINVGAAENGGENFFFELNITEEGWFDWSVECSDGVYSAFSGFNFTFSLFYPAGQINQSSFTITQTSNDGAGDITLRWNASDHTYNYRVYYSDDMKSITLLDSTLNTNYTDTTFPGSVRRFYRVDSWNPLGPNQSDTYMGAHIYTLKHNGNTRNWIAFPTNFTYLPDANKSLLDITNATSFTMWNSTLQQRVTCNNYTCPMYPSCTLTNCNFMIESGQAYEVNINSSAPSSVNWSGVGMVYGAGNVSLVKNSTSFGKNWVSMYANTSLVTDEDLISNITSADSASVWDAGIQGSRGIFPNPLPFGGGYLYYKGGFNIELERGYEVSVNETTLWERV